jgi:hypothetical protein
MSVSRGESSCVCRIHTDSGFTDSLLVSNAAIRWLGGRRAQLLSAGAREAEGRMEMGPRECGQLKMKGVDNGLFLLIVISKE